MNSCKFSVCLKKTHLIYTWIDNCIRTSQCWTGLGILEIHRSNPIYQPYHYPSVLEISSLLLLIAHVS